jgi:hypothetical protein
MQRHVWQRSLGLALIAGLCLTIIGCGGGGFAGSKITKANAEKIKEGMSEQEVTDILGPPDVTKDINAEMAGRPGSAGGGNTPKGKGVWTSSWKQGEKTITVFFTDGKVTKVSKAGLD